MDVNAILTPELTAIIITAFVVPILKNISKYVTTFIQSKIEVLQENIKIEKVNDYIDKAEDIIYSSVDAVAQSFVDVLKKEGNFDDDAKEEALTLAKERVQKQLSSDCMLYLEEAFDDLDSWIETKIETYVRGSK